jgi:hypothetical protein
VESVISNANETKVAGKVTDNNKNSDPDWLGLQVTASPGATFFPSEEGDHKMGMKVPEIVTICLYWHVV